MKKGKKLPTSNLIIQPTSENANMEKRINY